MFNNYFKILECCNHFGAVRGEESSAVKMRVTLLTCDDAPPRKEAAEKHQPLLSDASNNARQTPGKALGEKQKQHCAGSSKTERGPPR